MLKLKRAVNSFVLTKKKFKNRRMRGGAQSGPAGAAAGPAKGKRTFLNPFGSVTKTPDQLIKDKLIKTLIYAINADFDNCLTGIDKALKNISDPTSIVRLKKGNIHIPVTTDNINAAKERIATFGGENPQMEKELTKIKTEIEEKLVQLNRYKIEITTFLNKTYKTDIEKELSDLIKEKYTTEKIKSLSEVTKILGLFDKVGKTDLTVELIDKTSKYAKKEYKAFTDEILDDEKKEPREARSMFSFRSKAPVPVTNPSQEVKLNKMEFSVTTNPECTPQNCVATIVQKGGARKSKRSKMERSKTLKGGRRRR